MTKSLLEKLEKLRSGITEIMDEIRSQDQEAGPQAARHGQGLSNEELMRSPQFHPGDIA